MQGCWESGTIFQGFEIKKDPNLQIRDWPGSGRASDNKFQCFKFPMADKAYSELMWVKPLSLFTSDVIVIDAALGRLIISFGPPFTQGAQSASLHGALHTQSITVSVALEYLQGP